MPRCCRASSKFFPITLELVLYATPLIILVGVWLGTRAAIRKDRPIDHGIRVFAIVGYSLPTFWLGLILMMIFYGFLGIFPPGDLFDPSRDVVYSATSGFRRYTTLLTIDAHPELALGRLRATPCTTSFFPRSIS